MNNPPPTYEEWLLLLEPKVSFKQRVFRCGWTFIPLILNFFFRTILIK